MGLWETAVASLSPLNWWKLNETSGTTAADSAGSNTGQYQHTPNITYAQPSIIAGSTDKSVLFAGLNAASGQMIAGSNISGGNYLFPASNFSTAVVFQSSSGPGINSCGLSCLYSVDPPYYGEFSVLLDTNGYIAGGTDDTAGFKMVTGSTNLMDMLPHLVVLTWEPTGPQSGGYVPGVLSLYVDSGLVGSQSINATAAIGDQLDTLGFATYGEVGGFGSQYYGWDGYLQSYLVFDRTLSATDVTTLYSGFLNITVPGAPVLSNTPGNAQNALTWTTPSGSPTSYSLLRGTSSGGESATPIYTGSTASYTDTGLTNGTAYYYEVYATNAGGNGADSNEVAGTPFTVPSAPVLSGTAGLGMNTLSWTTPNNQGATITDYSVLRGTSSGGESGTPLYTDLVNGYIDAAVTPGTEYYYEVYATNVAGNSSDSNEVGLVPTAALSGLPLAPPAVAQADQNRTRVLITTGYPIAWGPESFGRGRSGK